MLQEGYTFIGEDILLKVTEMETIFTALHVFKVCKTDYIQDCKSATDLCYHRGLDLVQFGRCRKHTELQQLSPFLPGCLSRRYQAALNASLMLHLQTKTV